MLRPLLTASVLCLAAAAPAAHADLSYSYLRGGAFVNETDSALGEEDGTGLEVSGSYEILSFLHVFAAYRQSELDDFPLDLDVMQAGAGVNYDVSDNTSVYFNLAAVSAEADATVGGLGTIGADDDGYGYSLGFREQNATGRLEFGISAEHVEFDESDASDTWLDMRLLFRVTQRLRIETGVQFAGDENAARVGVRYYLPNRLDRRE
jgi:hypothetical protein